MIEYYLCSRSQSTGAHVIHTGGCPMLNEEDICLGIFDEADKAVLEGIKHFRKIKLCPFCLRESIKNRSSERVLVQYDHGMHKEYKQLSQALDSFMLCATN